ncbi:NAD-dependent epimerase/dehydratase family protein [Ferruginibacter paludis]|uniref:NAD-dependent epimerase/dehydratase family protein n=1 Tax=Ferruginibacter paludis TaxID=1310417 RepID=UPI0025B2FE76|nr:NAD-dependent epimerase/dehydratase family protein [Ferruginibacter paludis]MDN3657892.1 NAD-dependent epimerase/dehydratase family protein [Ferruginibacter paludis]
MKVVIIGGTGHIGTYLIPRLVMAGHEVICVSRNKSKPYSLHPLWKSVQHVTIDRLSAEANGTFGTDIKALQGEIVIDLICFTPQSAAMLTTALTGEVEHFIHCGTMWVHGHSEQVPTRESQQRKPFGEYGINKAAIESYLLSIGRQQGFPVTILHPGHITGPGWLPINPAGNLDPEIFRLLAKGETITLPNLGMETLHHVHAGDVAQAFMLAIGNRQRCIGESFHIVSEQALTLRGYAMAMATWYGLHAHLSFKPWEEWKKTVSERDAELTWIT